MDSKNGYDPTTKTYHSLYPSLDLPPETLPLSAANFALSLLRSDNATTTTDLETTTAFIDGPTGHSLSFSEFLCRAHSLAHALTIRNPQTLMSVEKGQVALILSPPSIHVPVLYFALLSLGIIVFPTDPLAENSDLVTLVTQAKPAILFTVSSLSDKVESLNYSFSHGTILLDSTEFNSMLMSTKNPKSFLLEYSTPVSQSDTAAMILSSSTTGAAKIVELTHRNLIASMAAHGAVTRGKPSNPKKPMVYLMTTKPELALGFSAILRNVAMRRSTVLLERCKELEAIMESLERYKVEVLYAYPALVGAMAAKENAEMVDKYDLSSLGLLICGGMQLHERHFSLFKGKFPRINIQQGYGLTEIASVAMLQLGATNESWSGITGRLLPHLVARIVDPTTADALPPGCHGELWLRGPTVMKGYVEDEELTAKRLDSKEGWLKTGDFCYFDSHGILHFVDRLKELISFNSHQVSPSELERVLLLHSEIEDAVVAPYADDEGREIPMALVLKKHGSTINESQIIDFVANKVEEYKKIKHVRFITSIPNFGKENSLPISHQGKIQRKLMLQCQYIKLTTTPAI